MKNESLKFMTRFLETRLEASVKKEAEKIKKTRKEEQKDWKFRRSL